MPRPMRGPRSVSGPRFDLLFLLVMLRRHEDSVQLAEVINVGVRSPLVRPLAATVTDRRQTTTRGLRDMIARRGYAHRDRYRSRPITSCLVALLHSTYRVDTPGHDHGMDWMLPVNWVCAQVGYHGMPTETVAEATAPATTRKWSNSSVPDTDRNSPCPWPKW